VPAIALTSSPLGQLADHVTTLSWSHDGSMVAAGSIEGDSMVFGIDAATHRLDDHPLGVLSMDWTKTATARLAVGGQDGTVQLWSAASGSTRITVKGWVNAIEWRGQGDTVGVAAGKDLVMLRTDGTELARHHHGSTVSALAWTPDGQRIAAGSYGGLWWYNADGTASKHFEFGGSVLTAAVSPNGKWVASGNQDASVHCWKLWSGDDLAMAGYEAKIAVIAWDPTGRYLAVGGVGDVTIWDFSGRGPQGSTPVQLVGHTRRIVALHYQPKSTLLWSVGADGRVCLWDPSRKSKRLVAELVLDLEAVSAAWRHDARALVVGSADGALVRVDVTAAS
jgi:WD40 repeat protein